MKKLGFVAIFAVVTVALTGCYKTTDDTVDVIPVVPENHETEQVAVTDDAEILYNEDGSIDTSNWLTYTNAEYGFSVKYPQEWKVETDLALPTGENDGFRSIFQVYPEELKEKMEENGDAGIRFTFAINEISFARASEEYKEYDIDLSKNPVRFLQTFYKATEPFNGNSDIYRTGNIVISFNNNQYWMINEVSRKITMPLLENAICIGDGENLPYGAALHIVEEGHYNQRIVYTCKNESKEIYKKQLRDILNSFELFE